MLAGGWFDPRDAELTAIRDNATRLMHRLNVELCGHDDAYRAALRELCLKRNLRFTRRLKESRRRLSQTAETSRRASRRISTSIRVLFIRCSVFRRNCLRRYSRFPVSSVGLLTGLRNFQTAAKSYVPDTKASANATCTARWTNVNKNLTRNLRIKNKNSPLFKTAAFLLLFVVLYDIILYC